MKNKKMGTEGFEPPSEALEATILARLYYVPDRFLFRQVIERKELI
jgi:hypothetical protein